MAFKIVTVFSLLNFVALWYQKYWTLIEFIESVGKTWLVSAENKYDYNCIHLISYFFILLKCNQKSINKFLLWTICQFVSRKYSSWPLYFITICFWSIIYKFITERFEKHAHMATCLYFIVDNTCGRRKGLFVVFWRFFCRYYKTKCLSKVMYKMNWSNNK